MVLQQGISRQTRPATEKQLPESYLEVLIGLSPNELQHSSEASFGAPEYGEHTEEVLLEYGFTQKEINELIELR